jgi:glycerol-3-phosphate dehydrogenase
MFDVVIVGSGVVGCAVARELSRYSLKICVVEKGSDIAEGTTKANSAIVHAGFDAKFESLKGKFNAKGNAMFDKLAKELDFPFKRNGSFVLCFEESEVSKLLDLKAQGERNGVPGLEILSKEQIKRMEPNLSDKVVSALYAPSGGIVCPYEMTVSLAENAYDNGVEFKFNQEVVSIEKRNNFFIIKTPHETIATKLIVNAAGLFSDSINNMISNYKINITPRKGEYCLFDKAVGGTVQRTIFQVPTAMGKGILVTPTIDGNLLIGPNAVDIEDKGDLSTTSEGMDEILTKAKLTIGEIPMRYVITSFSGLRAHGDNDDFIIGEAADVPNFINAAAIESPGLSSAPSIAEYIKDIIVNKLSPECNPSFTPLRKGIPKFREMSNEERAEAIKKNPAYGKMVCRCEMVTEGEIIEAINRPLGAKTLDGLKRRTRAGMGRCQAGFCTPKLVTILAKELNISPEEVTKFGGRSKLLVGKDKEI